MPARPQRRPWALAGPLAQAPGHRRLRRSPRPKTKPRSWPQAADDEDFDKLSPNGGTSDDITRLQEERRLMYVGITRARDTLMVSWTKKKKAGRDMVSAIPSRFIAEMALDVQTIREDPMAKLKALRAEFAKKVADAVPVTD